MTTENSLERGFLNASEKTVNDFIQPSTPESTHELSGKIVHQIVESGNKGGKIVGERFTENLKGEFGFTADQINKYQRPILFALIAIGVAFCLPRDFLIIVGLAGALFYALVLSKTLTANQNINPKKTMETQKKEENKKNNENTIKESLKDSLESGVDASKIGGDIALTEVITKLTPVPTTVATKIIPPVTNVIGTVIKASGKETIDFIGNQSEKSDALNSLFDDEEPTVEEKKYEFEAPHVLEETQKINPNRWAVSEVRKLNGKYPLHMSLHIHTMDEKGQQILFRAHLVRKDDDKKTDHTTTFSESISKEPKKAEILIDDYTETLLKDEPSVRKYYEDCKHRTVFITAKKGLELIQFIKNEQSKEIYYNLIDGNLLRISRQSSSSKDFKNCAGWAEYVLGENGIKFKETAGSKITLFLIKLFVYDPRFILPK